MEAGPGGGGGGGEPPPGRGGAGPGSGGGEGAEGGVGALAARARGAARAGDAGGAAHALAGLGRALRAGTGEEGSGAWGEAREAVEAGFGAQAVLNGAGSAPALLRAAAAALRRSPGLEGDAWAHELLQRRVKALHLVMHAGGRARAEAALELLGAAAERGGAVGRDVLERVDWGKMVPRALIRTSQPIPTERSRRRDAGAVATRGLLVDLVLSLAAAGGAEGKDVEQGCELLPDLEREVQLLGAVLQGAAHDSDERATRELRLGLRILRRPRLQGVEARALLRGIFSPPVLSQLCALAARADGTTGADDNAATEVASLACETLSGLLANPAWGLLEAEAASDGALACVLPSRKLARGRAVGLLLRLQAQRYPTHFRLLVEALRRRPALGLALAQVWPFDPHPGPSAHWTVSTAVLIAVVEVTHTREALRGAIPRALGASLSQGQGLGELDSLGARAAVEPLLRRLFWPSYQKKALSRGLKHTNAFVLFRTLCLLEALLEAAQHVDNVLRELTDVSHTDCTPLRETDTGCIGRSWQACVLGKLPDLAELFAAHAALEAGGSVGEVDADTFETLKADAAFQKRQQSVNNPGRDDMDSFNAVNILKSQIQDTLQLYLRTFPDALMRVGLDPFKLHIGLKAGETATNGFDWKSASFENPLRAPGLDEGAACAICSDERKLQKLLNMHLAREVENGEALTCASSTSLVNVFWATGMFCGNVAEIKALIDALVVTHNHYPVECDSTVVPFVAHAVAHVLKKADKVQDDLQNALSSCPAGVREGAAKSRWNWSPLVPVLLQQACLLLASSKRTEEAKSAVSQFISMPLLCILSLQGDSLLANVLLSTSGVGTGASCIPPSLKAAAERDAAGLVTALDDRKRIHLSTQDFVEASTCAADFAAKMNDSSFLSLSLLCLKHCRVLKNNLDSESASAVAKSLRKCLAKMLASGHDRQSALESSQTLNVLAAVEGCLPTVAEAGPQALHECLRIITISREHAVGPAHVGPHRAIGLEAGPLSSSVHACCARLLDCLRSPPLSEGDASDTSSEKLKTVESAVELLPLCTRSELWDIYHNLANGLDDFLGAGSEPQAKRQRIEASCSVREDFRGAGISLLICAACHLLARGDAPAAAGEGDIAFLVPCGNSLPKWQSLLDILEVAFAWGARFIDRCNLQPALLALPGAIAVSPFSSTLGPTFFPLKMVPALVSRFLKKDYGDVPTADVSNLVGVLAGASSDIRRALQTELLKTKPVKRLLKKKSICGEVPEWLAPALRACLSDAGEGNENFSEKCFSLSFAYLSEAWNHVPKSGVCQSTASLESMQLLLTCSLDILRDSAPTRPAGFSGLWGSMCCKSGWFISVPALGGHTLELELLRTSQRLATVRALLRAFGNSLIREAGDVKVFFKAASSTVEAMASVERALGPHHDAMRSAFLSLTECVCCVFLHSTNDATSLGSETQKRIRSFAAVLLKNFFHNGWACTCLIDLVDAAESAVAKDVLSTAEARSMCSDLADLLLEHSQFVSALSEPGPELPEAAARVPTPLQTLLPVLDDDIWECGEADAEEQPFSSENLRLKTRGERKTATVTLLCKLLECLCGATSRDKGEWRADSRLQTLLLLSYGGTRVAEDVLLLRCVELLQGAGGEDSDIAADDDEVGEAGLRRAALARHGYEFGDALRRAKFPGVEQRPRLSAGRVLAAMDGRRVALAALSLPIYATVEVGHEGMIGLSDEVDSIIPRAAAVLHRHALQHAYNPLVLLDFVAFHQNQGSILVSELARAGLLSLMLCGLASDNHFVRKRCYCCLERVLGALAEEDFREKPQIGALLLAVKNAITRPWQRIPAPSAVFAAECVLVCLRPAGFLYPVVNKALLKRPFLQLNDLPVFYQIFSSGTTTMGPEREWLFRLMAASLADGRDKKSFRRRMALEAMMDRYQQRGTRGCSPGEKQALRGALWRAVAIPRFARDLFLHGGLGAWLLWLLQVPDSEGDTGDSSSAGFALCLFELLLKHKTIRRRVTAGHRFPEYKLALAVIARQAAGRSGSESGPGVGLARVLNFAVQLGQACEEHSADPDFLYDAVPAEVLVRLLQEAYRRDKVLREAGVGHAGAGATESMLAMATTAGVACLPPETPLGGSPEVWQHGVRLLAALALRAASSPQPMPALDSAKSRFLIWADRVVGLGEEKRADGLLRIVAEAAARVRAQ